MSGVNGLTSNDLFQTNQNNSCKSNNQTKELQQGNSLTLQCKVGNDHAEQGNTTIQNRSNTRIDGLFSKGNKHKRNSIVEEAQNHHEQDISNTSRLIYLFSEFLTSY